MRVVVDTNVLVSGLLSPFGPPGTIVGLIAAGRISLCYDARILAENADVLLRPRFPFAEGNVRDLLLQIEVEGELASPSPWPDRLPDAHDEAFLEVAATSSADYLVTGNVKHFPPDLRSGVQVISPREFVDNVLRRA